MKRSLLVLVSALISSVAVAQNVGGYYVNRTVTYPDTALAIDALGLPMSFNREDVKAIGMGKTQLANGAHFNAMMYNPALLSHERQSFDIPGVQASIPAQSITAMSFLKDHITDFKNGDFLKIIKSGVDDLKNATTLDEELAALRKIQSGLRFANEAQEKVGGTQDNPRTHGISIIPSLQAQIGNWGFSLYGIAQTGFQLFSGQAITNLASLKIPESVDQLTPELLLQVLAAVEPLFDVTGNLSNDALPEVYSVSYIDIVGAVGYAYEVNKSLSVGANVKVVNRRISSKHIEAKNFNRILEEASSDFRAYITGATLDLGALYTFEKTGTKIGLSLQNIIPVQHITSNIIVNTAATGIQDYDRDNNGRPIVNAAGDTALVAARRKVQITIPVELQTPVLVNLGVVHPLTEEWDVALDWVDIASQDKKFENYFDRFRIGSEYRLDITKDKFGVAFRAGLAEKRPTVGIGFNFFRVVQLDGAYAHDNFIGEDSYFAQLKIGW